MPGAPQLGYGPHWGCLQHRLFVYLGLRGAAGRALALAACLDTSVEAVHAEHRAHNPLAPVGICPAVAQKP